MFAAQTWFSYYESVYQQGLTSSEFYYLNGFHSSQFSASFRISEYIVGVGQAFDGERKEI